MTPDQVASCLSRGGACLAASIEAAACLSVSVVMPVRNEEAHLGRVLDQLLAQDYPAHCYEILVVDGDSTDATRQIAESYEARHANVRVLANSKRLSSAARNIGIEHSRGRLIVIVDGHCEIDGPSYLHNLADAFHRSAADCLGRPQPLDMSGATALQRAIAAARSSWLGHHPASFIYSSDEQYVPAKSVAVAYRREVFDRIGLFDESFDACEDVELNHRIDRAGLRCFFTPKVGVRYVPRSSLRGLFRQLVRYGKGRTRLLRKHPETFSLTGFIPAFWLLGLACGPLFALNRPSLWIVYLSIILLYLVCVVSASLSIVVRSSSYRLLLWLPLVFATIHASSGYGILREFFCFPWMRLAGSRRH